MTIETIARSMHTDDALRVDLLDAVGVPQDARPHCALIVAVLILAIADLHTKRLARATRRWFVSDATDACSFRWICALLDLDAPIVRRRVLARRSFDRSLLRMGR